MGCLRRKVESGRTVCSYARAMNLSLHGRRAVVCGSTAGIGRACAMALAGLGAQVTLISRSPDKLKAVCDELPRVELPHSFIAAEFSDGLSVKAAADTLRHDARGHHILINNTGGPPAGTAIDAEPAAFLAAFGAHLIAGQLFTQAVVPGMKAASYGRVINIISTSVKAPIPNLGVSNTIRGAMASWAKTLATELGPFGITVNNILPGFTSTDRLTSLLSTRAAKQKVSEAEVAREIIAGIPAGRFAAPEEIGAAAAFLASPAAAYINGINLPVDGGRLQSL